MINIMINNLLQQACESIADYSETQIPVTIALDLENSILTPEPGVLQRFCYIVTQVEEPIGLSYWILGICPTITEDDLGEVTVFINEVEQEVILGDNVEITDDDPTTGCAGLKFDFGLEEAGDVMTVCFELTTTRQIGPNIVCIKGGANPEDFENSLTICGPLCEIPEACNTTIFQNIGICVPVIITPFAEVGPIGVTCCGPTIVSTTPCNTGDHRSCTFYVRQNVCAEVPVRFGATGDNGDTVVTCGAPSQEGCDCGA